jgi:hypothetical protein
MNKDREQAIARKKEQIYGSNVGLSTPPRPAPRPGSGGFEEDNAPNLGTMPAAQSRGRQPSSNIWDVDSGPPHPGPTRNAASEPRAPAAGHWAPIRWHGTAACRPTHARVHDQAGCRVPLMLAMLCTPRAHA